MELMHLSSAKNESLIIDVKKKKSNMFKGRGCLEINSVGLKERDKISNLIYEFLKNKTMPGNQVLINFYYYSDVSLDDRFIHLGKEHDTLCFLGSNLLDKDYHKLMDIPYGAVSFLHTFDIEKAKKNMKSFVSFEKTIEILAQDIQWAISFDESGILTFISDKSSTLREFSLGFMDLYLRYCEF